MLLHSLVLGRFECRCRSDAEDYQDDATCSQRCCWGASSADFGILAGLNGAVGSSEVHALGTGFRVVEQTTFGVLIAVPKLQQPASRHEIFLVICMTPLLQSENSLTILLEIVLFSTSSFPS